MSSSGREAGTLSFERERRRLLVQRMRAGAWVVLFSLAVFSLLDLQLPPRARAGALGMKLVQLGLVAGALLAIRHPDRERYVEWTAFAAVSGLYLTTAVSGIITENADIPVVLFMVIAMATATLLPWGPGLQIASLGVAAAGVGWNGWALGTVIFSGHADLGAALLIAFTASVYVAWELDRDGRARSAAEQRLRRSEKQLAEAQRIAHAGSWHWNTVGDRVVWSDELYRIYGLEPGKFGATYEAYLARVHPDDRERANTVIQGAIRRGGTFSLEERVVRPDGSVRVVESRGEVSTDESGKPTGMTGVCLDVTDRKRVEAELEQARDAALEASRLKSAFLTNMSHEIRTPLNIILGTTSVLVDRFRDADGIESRLLQRISNGSKRLLSTLDRVLDLSRIASGSFDVQPVPVDAASVLDQVVEEWAPVAREKGLALECAGADRPAWVRMDEYCLSRALGNLIENAIKFTPEGAVRIRLEREGDGGVTIEVRDTGIGIDPAYVPRLFEPFSQEETGTTRRFEGAGIGLALVRHYLERNGARVTADSRKGAGTSFTVHLPAPDRGSASATGSGSRGDRLAG